MFPTKGGRQRKVNPVLDYNSMAVCQAMASKALQQGFWKHKRGHFLLRIIVRKPLHRYPLPKTLPLSRRMFRSKYNISPFCHPQNQNQNQNAVAPEVQLSVFRFTLGIPGFDESNLPRITGFAIGFLLVLNHVISQDSATPAQTRTEAIGSILSVFAISLPYFGKLLRGTNVPRRPTFPVGQQIFLLSENLSVEEKEDLAWGTYALLQNTSSTSVLVYHLELLCARGFWDIPTKPNEDIYTALNDDIKQLSIDTKSSIYLPNGAGKQGWKIIPKGTVSLLLQPFHCRGELDGNVTSHGFVLLLSNTAQAYSDKDRAWLTALTEKFKHIKCSTRK